eukprot:tig00000692_g3204.t1
MVQIVVDSTHVEEETSAPAPQELGAESSRSVEVTASGARSNNGHRTHRAGPGDQQRRTAGADDAPRAVGAPVTARGARTHRGLGEQAAEETGLQEEPPQVLLGPHTARTAGREGGQRSGRRRREGAGSTSTREADGITKREQDSGMLRALRGVVGMLEPTLGAAVPAAKAGLVAPADYKPSSRRSSRRHREDVEAGLAFPAPPEDPAPPPGAGPGAPHEEAPAARRQSGSDRARQLRYPVRRRRLPNTVPPKVLRAVGRANPLLVPAVERLGRLARDQRYLRLLLLVLELAALAAALALERWADLPAYPPEAPAIRAGLLSVFAGEPEVRYPPDSVCGLLGSSRARRLRAAGAGPGPPARPRRRHPAPPPSPPLHAAAIALRALATAATLAALATWAAWFAQLGAGGRLFGDVRGLEGALLALERLCLDRLGRLPELAPFFPAPGALALAPGRRASSSTLSSASLSDSHDEEASLPPELPPPPPRPACVPPLEIPPERPPDSLESTRAPPALNAAAPPSPHRFPRPPGGASALAPHPRGPGRAPRAAPGLEWRTPGRASASAAPPEAGAGRRPQLAAALETAPQRRAQLAPLAGPAGPLAARGSLLGAVKELLGGEGEGEGPPEEAAKPVLAAAAAPRGLRPFLEETLGPADEWTRTQAALV